MSSVLYSKFFAVRHESVGVAFLRECHMFPAAPTRAKRSEYARERVWWCCRGRVYSLTPCLSEKE